LKIGQQTAVALLVLYSVGFAGCTIGVPAETRRDPQVKSAEHPDVSLRDCANNPIGCVRIPTCQPSSEYQQYIDKLLAKGSRGFDETARSGDVRRYWHFAYLLDGVTTAYQATKDPAYIMKALAWAEAMIATATIVDSGGHKNWRGAWASPYASTSIAYQLDDLIVGQVLARVARDILVDSAVAGTYGNRAHAVYDFVNRNIAVKWLVARQGEWFFVHSAKSADRMSNKVPLLGLILMDLVAVSPNTRYSDLLSIFAAAHADRLQAVGNGGALWLDTAAPTRDGDSSDTAHGGIHVYFITRAYEEGWGVRLSHLQGVADLFTTILWNGSISDPMFRNYTNGTNGNFRNRGPWGNGFIVSGWQTLAKHDAAAKRTVASVFDAMMARRRNPSIDYMNTVSGRIELAAHLMLAECDTAPIDGHVSSGLTR
jgi:hypothetical protein